MEDSGEEEKRFCKNCQRDVSAANFVMHEVHCARNITCCPQCNEPVPRSSLEDHIEENHKQVICKLCRKQMECCLLEDHMVHTHCSCKNTCQCRNCSCKSLHVSCGNQCQCVLECKESECMMRMVDCQYCELQVKALDRYQHEDQCGSRTDVCEKCQQYVMLKKMKEHEENLCGKPAETTSPPHLPPDEWLLDEFHPAERGGAGAHVGGAVEPVGLDQSWMDALNACREDGQSVDSIVAQNLAHENHMFRQPLNTDAPTSDEELAVKLEHNEEPAYYDTSSSSAVEEQKRQFEQLRQLQADAELAQKLQEQLDAEDELSHMMPHGDHMMPHGDHMVLNDDQMLPHMGHMMPDRDHMTPDRDHMMPHIDQAMFDEDHVMPNNDWVLNDDHNKDHMMHNVDHMRSTTDQMTPSMDPPMDHMMSYDNQIHGLPNDFANLHVTKPKRNILPKEDLIPCEWCNKGIPPEYLQTHQLQHCPKLPDKDKAFLPPHVTDIPPPVATNVADHNDITPTREGTYSVVCCQYCNARIPSDQYHKHLDLCDNANETGPCEHCNQSIPLHELFQHEVTCRQNDRLYRPPAMKFPNSQWPMAKGRGSHKATQWSQTKARRLDPVTIPTDTSVSSSDNSYHGNGDKLPSYHDFQINDNSSNDSNTSKRHVTKHDQLTRRQLHAYTPAGAGSVSVNGTGIHVTPHPPFQH